MSLLDRTYSFSLRQLLRWAKRLLLMALPFYIVALFWHEWTLVNGGVAPYSSPYLAMIPKDCVALADRNSGLGYMRQWRDMLLFEGRIHRVPIKPAVTPYFGSCYGYAIIGNLHSGGAGSGFTDVFEDEVGKPVVTINVTFHRRYVRPANETAREKQP